jgi:hypothetical protein
VRGRLFEAIVIRRFILSRLSAADCENMRNDDGLRGHEVDLAVNALQEIIVDRIQGQSFPNLPYGGNQIKYYVPISSNFPAVDLIIHVGKVVIAFQIHVSDHNDVLSSLINKVSTAGWNKERVQTIILVYLSPTINTARALEKRIRRAPLPAATGTIRYFTLFYTIQNFDALKNLQW